MEILKPFILVRTGEFIKEDMEFRNWTNKDLTKVSGINSKTIRELLDGKQRITLDTARVLGEAFGQSKEYWLNLDNNYHIGWGKTLSRRQMSKKTK